MITFQNEGVASVAALTTFGINAKNNDSAIGFFGTGFKYAVAIVLRNGGKVTLYLGKKKHTFGLNRITERGQDFDVVTLSGKPLGFTTRLGIKWEPWMAYREFHCNAADESGETYGYKVAPKEGYTTIQVEWPEFELAHQNRHIFLLQTKPIYQGQGVDVHPGSSHAIFYRGVMVGKLEKPSAYTYNITSHVNLTEDRLVKYSWEPLGVITRALVGCTDPRVVRESMTTGPDMAEGQLSVRQCGADPSSAWLETVGDIMAGPQSSLLSSSTKELLAEHRPAAVLDERVVLTDEENAMLETALHVLEQNGCSRIRYARIVPVAFLGHGVLGLMKQGVIYLSRKCFTAGLINVVGTLFEEYAHLELKQVDCTRDFQNFLIDALARALLEKNDGYGYHNAVLSDRRRPTFLSGAASAPVASQPPEIAF